MSLQSTLNQQTIDMLPLVKQTISNCTDFYTQDRMKQRVIRECSRASISIEKMTQAELLDFQNMIIEIFKFINNN